MNIKLFKANVIIIGSLFLIALVYSAMQPEAHEVNNVTNTFEPKDIIYIAAGLYLFFAMIQTIIFACKTIAKLELKREVSFGDYFNNLLLMFFFFVGIWFLQPKVNRLIAIEDEIAF
jgi:hypothetical protein